MSEESRAEGSPSRQAPSEWETFFTSKVSNAGALLKTLRTQGFHMPSEAETQRIIDRIVTGKGGFARLLTLLQVLGPERDSALELAAKLAELSLQRYGLLGPIAAEDNRTVVDIAKEWLGNISKARLSPAQRDALLVFILLHWRTGRLSDNQVLEVLNLMVSPRPSKKRLKAEVVAPSRPTEALLRIVTGKANLKGLLELSTAWRHHAAQVDAARRFAESARDEAVAARDGLQQSADHLRQEVEQLRAVGTELERRIRELEVHGNDLRTDFQHRLDEMRGRLQGALDGEISRWLQTAYEASVLSLIHI